MIQHSEKSRSRSVTQLTGCPAFAWHDKRKLRLDPCNGLRKVSGGEWREILDALADADEMHRKPVLFRQRHQDAATRGAVELSHHQPRDARRTMKRLHLRQRILSHRGIEHQ